MINVEETAVGDAHQVLVSDQRVGVLANQRSSPLGCVGTTFGGIHVSPAQNPVDAELQERSCLLHSPAEPLGIGAKKVSGVGIDWQVCDSELQTELLLPLVDPLGCRLAGSVSVKGQDHPRSEPGKLAGVIRRHRRATGGYGSFKAG